MEDKDYIYIFDEKGRKTRMQLVLAMKLENGEEYIAYKEESKTVPIYMAKIQIKNGLMDLDTNITDEVKEKLKSVLKEKITGEKND